MSRYHPLHAFRSGQTISSSALNENFSQLEVATNNAQMARPGNGVSRENLGKRSIPPTALERPNMQHVWGISLRHDAFDIGGVTNRYGINSSRTFHLAKPEQDVTITRIAGYIGENLAAPTTGQIKYVIDGVEFGVVLNLESPGAQWIDLQQDVTAGSTIELKYINTHDGSFVKGSAWVYAESLPWI